MSEKPSKKDLILDLGCGEASGTIINLVKTKVISEGFRKMENKPKVIIIGLDGATWDLIKPWAEEGRLPTFKYLMENGAWGVLESTIPPLSPSAWVSIYTGCKPSEHGVFGFLKRKKNSYTYSLITSKDIKRPTIWTILSEYGKRVAVINAPFIYPPRHVRGILISGFGTPSVNSTFTYPPEIKTLILNKYPDYDVCFNEQLFLLSRKFKELLSKIERVSKAQMQLTLDCIEEKRYDFIFSVFMTLDVLQHYFINDKELLLRFYKLFDEMLNDMLKSIDDSTYVVIVSDHGHCRVNKYFCVNNWLLKLGLLNVKSLSTNKGLNLGKMLRLLTKWKIDRFIFKLTPILKKWGIFEILLKIIPTQEYSNTKNIDWKSTKAYFYKGSNGIISINLKGREPAGIVTKENCREIVEYIVRNLKNVKDPETSEVIVEKVYTKWDLYQEDNTQDEEIPEIFFILKKGYEAVEWCENNIDSIFMQPIRHGILRCGGHTLDGIFLFYNKNTKLKITKKLRTWDIVPIVLRIFDCERMLKNYI